MLIHDCVFRPATGQKRPTMESSLRYCTVVGRAACNEIREQSVSESRPSKAIRKHRSAIVKGLERRWNIEEAVAQSLVHQHRHRVLMDALSSRSHVQNNSHSLGGLEKCLLGIRPGFTVGLRVGNLLPRTELERESFPYGASLRGRCH